MKYNLIRLKSKFFFKVKVNTDITEIREYISVSAIPEITDLAL